MGPAGRTLEQIITFGARVAGLMVLLMALQIVAEVIARNLFRTSISGTLDFVQYLWMPGIALLGLGLAQ